MRLSQYFLIRCSHNGRRYWRAILFAPKTDDWVTEAIKAVGEKETDVVAVTQHSTGEVARTWGELWIAGQP